MDQLEQQQYPGERTATEEYQLIKMLSKMKQLHIEEEKDVKMELADAGDDDGGGVPVAARYTHICTGHRCRDYDCRNEEAMMTSSSDDLGYQFATSSSTVLCNELIAYEEVTTTTTTTTVRVVSSRLVGDGEPRPKYRSPSPPANVNDLTTSLANFQIDQVKPGSILREKVPTRPPTAIPRQTVSRIIKRSHRTVTKSTGNCQTLPLSHSSAMAETAVNDRLRVQARRQSAQYRQVNAKRWQAYLVRTRTSEQQHQRRASFKAIQFRIEQNRELLKQWQARLDAFYQAAGGGGCGGNNFRRGRGGGRFSVRHGSF